jgi:hypothetical protein
MEPFRDRANLQNPQTLNLYSYVQNNPLSRRDATGHYSCASDTVSTNANGDTVVTAGACHFDLSDLPQIAVAVGHHFLPQKMLRIPAEADQHSWMKPITIPAHPDHRSGTPRSLIGFTQEC